MAYHGLMPGKLDTYLWWSYAKGARQQLLSWSSSISTVADAEDATEVVISCAKVFRSKGMATEGLIFSLGSGTKLVVLKEWPKEALMKCSYQHVESEVIDYKAMINSD